MIQKSGIDPAEVLGVGVSAQMFNLLPVDEDCRPLTRMLSWLDVRSVSQADRLLTGAMRAFLYEHTGNVPTAKDVVPKILWLKEERPDLWERTRWLLDCKEYILFKLTGVVAIDWHGASVFFLFDPHTKTWDEEVCARLGHPGGEVAARVPVNTGHRRRHPRRRPSKPAWRAGTPVVICAGDVAVAQSGSGANAEGRAHLCIGTATWVGVSSTTLRNDPEKPFWALNHIDPDKWIIAGEMETGGGALQWYRDASWPGGSPPGEGARRLDLPGLSTSWRLPRRRAATSLLFAPWLSGERAPVLDHYARGGFLGLSLGHTTRPPDPLGDGRGRLPHPLDHRGHGECGLRDRRAAGDRGGQRQPAVDTDHRRYQRPAAERSSSIPSKPERWAQLWQSRWGWASTRIWMRWTS